MYALRKCTKTIAEQNCTGFIVCSFYNVAYLLSHDVASGGDITSCNKIDKPLVIYKFGPTVAQLEVFFSSDYL